MFICVFVEADTSTIEATVSGDYLEIDLPEDDDDVTPRRSSRQRNTKSALQLLGISPKKEKRTDEPVEAQPLSKRRRLKSEESIEETDGKAKQKNPEEIKSQNTPEPRKRGRPKKESMQSEESIEETDGKTKQKHVEEIKSQNIPEPKKRGRPRKDSVQTEESIEETGDMVKQKTGEEITSQITSEPRKRGRPRKDSVQDVRNSKNSKNGTAVEEIDVVVFDETIEQKTDSTSEVQNPRRRGRPRKYGTHEADEKDKLSSKTEIAESGSVKEAAVTTPAIMGRKENEKPTDDTGEVEQEEGSVGRRRRISIRSASKEDEDKEAENTLQQRSSRSWAKEEELSTVRVTRAKLQDVLLSLGVDSRTSPRRPSVDIIDKASRSKPTSPAIVSIERATSRNEKGSPSVVSMEQATSRNEKVGSAVGSLERAISKNDKGSPVVVSLEQGSTSINEKSSSAIVSVERATNSRNKIASPAIVSLEQATNRNKIAIPAIVSVEQATHRKKASPAALSVERNTKVQTQESSGKSSPEQSPHIPTTKQSQENKLDTNVKTTPDQPLKVFVETPLYSMRKSDVPCESIKRGRGRPPKLSAPRMVSVVPVEKPDKVAQVAKVVVTKQEPVETEVTMTVKLPGPTTEVECSGQPAYVEVIDLQAIQVEMMENTANTVQTQIKPAEPADAESRMACEALSQLAGSVQIKPAHTTTLSKGKIAFNKEVSDFL